MTLFSSRLANSNLAQESVVGVDDSVASQCRRINVQDREASALFFGQVLRVGLINAELLQSEEQLVNTLDSFVKLGTLSPSEHDLRESSLAVFRVLGAQSVEYLGGRLRRLVQHASFNCSDKQVVRGSDGCS